MQTNHSRKPFRSQIIRHPNFHTLMKTRIQLISLHLILIAGLTLSSAFAQKSWNELEYPEINSFTVPEVEQFTLDNGITFYLMEDRELPLIDLSVIVRTGSFLEPVEKTGLASMTGQVMRSGGSANYPKDVLNELLENKAASMSTGIGFTSGSARMNVLKEDFPELLEVFIDLIQNPVFPQDQIDLVKTQTNSGISRRNDDQSGIASREFRSLIYGKNNVFSSIEEYETIAAITREDMIALHEASFVGNNMMVGVIGDFRTREMKRWLKDAFSGIPKGDKIEIDLPEVEYEFASGIHFINKSDVNQSYVLMGHIGGMRDNPDYAKLQVMNQVLSGGFSSRLFNVVRTEMGLAYSVFGSYGSGNFYPGTFTAGVMTQSQSTSQAIDAIIQQIERLQNELVTAEELQLTKDQFLNSLVFRYDSRSKVLNERISYTYSGLPADTFDKLVEEIKEVTAEDIMEVAKAYLRPDALQILVVGNASELGDQLTKYGEVNEIDISIPMPGEKNESDDADRAGDPEAGMEWAGKMASAIFPGGGLSGAVVTEGSQMIQTPQGEMSIGMKQTINYMELSLRADVQSPMGSVTMEIGPNGGQMIMGANTMPMQPAQAEQTIKEIKRDPLYIASNLAELSVNYTGMEEYNGRELVRLTVEGDLTMNIWLDPETSLPAVISYSEFSPEAGGQITMKNELSDWREAAGVMMAYQTDTFMNDEKVTSMILESHSVPETE